MANVVYIATSIDGYIARKDGNIDWLMEIPNPENSDYGFSSFIDRMDGILMGRNTFEVVCSFDEWPYTKPVFVLSNTLREIPEKSRGKAEVVSGNLPEIVDSLKLKGFHNLYIDGGKTIQGFLQEDLIDELVITRIPVILGSGIPLFADTGMELKLDLVSTEILNKDLVKSTYRRKKLLKHMKVITLAILISLSGVLYQCNPQKPREEKSLEITDQLQTQSGKIFIVRSDKSLGASISKVTVETRAFDVVNDTYDLGDIDPVENIFLSDLDGDGYEELYLTTRSAGSGSYSNIYGFASNRDKSVSQIYVPEISELGAEHASFFFGYRGHNSFSVEDGILINEFPVYAPTDTNAEPTQNRRIIYYLLEHGEAGRILRPFGQDSATK